MAGWVTMEVVLGVTVTNYTHFVKFSHPKSFKACSRVRTPIMWLIWSAAFEELGWKEPHSMVMLGVCGVVCLSALL